MKVTYNWLKQYVDFDWTVEELAERITMLGVEVEGMESSGGTFEGIVVGEVIAREQHPNADRLTLCKVNDGNGERQIVCGATNFEAGDKVALALPGTSMPVEEGEKPFILKEGKIRGELSQGMMCSGRELNLNDEHEGILVLPGDAHVGQSFAEHLGQAESDVVYDLEITPNRPDLNGVIGLAREVAALTRNPLTIPEVPKVSSGNKAADLVDVRIEDNALCPRYNACVIEGVRVGPSPEWLTSILEKVGIRSINNIVDITNYVMMETGQPLHAFDLHLLAKTNDKPTVVVRRASNGEKFTTLDEQEHKLTSDNLLIADPEKGIALAGVMGGFNTEIKENTRDVLLETAYFCPKNIRATAKNTGLHTDASYRFERGADVGVVEWASQRAAQLIAEVSGGTVAEGEVDVFPDELKPFEIRLRHHRTDELLGIAIDPNQSVAYLLGLQLELSAQDDLSATFLIPTWRVDLKREIDLIEEICRLHGIDQIPATPPRGCIGENEFDSIHDNIAEVRRILTGIGLDEAQGQTLISDTSAQLVADEFVGLEHPLSNDMDVLRPSLLPGLLDSLRNNFTRQNHDVSLFEIGRVFEVGLKECRRLGIVIAGRRQREDARLDAADLKGIIDKLLERIGAFGINYERREAGTNLFLESAELKMGKNVIGQMGQLLPVLGKEYGSRDAIFLAELDLEILLKRRTTNKSFKSLPKFPAIERDVAMLVAESVTHAEVLVVVKNTKAANLVDTELFDVFRGQNVPEGQKSLAYSFTYRSAEKTLTDEEVNGAHESLVVAFKEKLGAMIRDN